MKVRKKKRISRIGVKMVEEKNASPKNSKAKRRVKNSAYSRA